MLKHKEGVALEDFMCCTVLYQYQYKITQSRHDNE